MSFQKNQINGVPIALFVTLFGFAAKGLKNLPKEYLMNKLKELALRFAKPLLHKQIENLGDKLELALVKLVKKEINKISPEELAKKLIDKLQEKLHEIICCKV